MLKHCPTLHRITVILLHYQPPFTGKQFERDYTLDFLRSRNQIIQKTLSEDTDDLKYTSDESRLIGVLLSRYKSHKTLARPVLNSNDTLTVYFGLDLQQILDFDEKDQVLQTRMWKEYVSITENKFPN